MGRKCDFQLILEGLRAGKILRVEVAGLGEEDLVLVEELCILGFLHEYCPVVGVRDVDQGLGPLPDRPAREIGDPELRYDHVEGFLVGELVGVVGNRDEDVRLALAVAAGKGEDRAPAPGEGRPGE